MVTSHLAMGQNPVHLANIPIPTKIGSKMGGAPTPKWDPIGFDPLPVGSLGAFGRLARASARHRREATTQVAEGEVATRPVAEGGGVASCGGGCHGHLESILQPYPKNNTLK